MQQQNRIFNEICKFSHEQQQSLPNSRRCTITVTDAQIITFEKNRKKKRKKCGWHTCTRDQDDKLAEGR